ncbi:MAG: hypothetical protein LJD31_03595 [Wolbachia endosymbiont of Menacanthus eurysternus]|nr:hypothetical protein [Wolbachia endosymbiont of Menacanthus eurysternus]
MGALEQQRIGIQNSKENIAMLLQWLCEQAKETGTVLVCTKIIVDLCAIREPKIITFFCLRERSLSH